MKHRYDFSLQLDGEDFSSWSDHSHWLGADSLQAFGNDFDECCRNAVIFTQDQDGGEGPQVAIEDLSTLRYNQYAASIQDEIDRIDDRRGAE